MKTLSKMTLAIGVALAMGGPLEAQLLSTSSTIAHNAVTGTGVISRTNSSEDYNVVGSNIDGLEAMFTVGTKVRKMPIMEYQINDSRSGYTVKSMEFTGDICYFCGTRWHETAEPTIMTDGSVQLSYSYTTIGFVGRFNVVSINNWGTQFEYVHFSEVSELSKLRYSGNGVVCLGKDIDDGSTVILEMVDSTSTDWYYRIGKSPRADEVFTDLASGHTKTAIVSRFDGSLDQAMMKNNIGLRYGGNGGICSGSNKIYNYDVRDVFFFNGAAFTSLSPVLLGHNGIGNEMYLAYLGQIADFNHKLMMFCVDSEGDDDLKIQRDLTSGTDYLSIAEMRFPKGSSYQMALLMESTAGESTLRFPRWDGPTGSKTDTILYTTDLKLQSLDVFLSNLGGISVDCGAYNPTANNKVFRAVQNDIHQNSNWSNSSCRSSRTSNAFVETREVSPEQISLPMSVTIYKPVVFLTGTFVPSSTTRTTDC